MMWNIFEFVRWPHLDSLLCEVPAQIICSFFFLFPTVYILLFCRNALFVLYESHADAGTILTIKEGGVYK